MKEGLIAIDWPGNLLIIGGTLMWLLGGQQLRPDCVSKRAIRKRKETSDLKFLSVTIQ